jgi:hypothetical protein
MNGDFAVRGIVKESIKSGLPAISEREVLTGVGVRKRSVHVGDADRNHRVLPPVWQQAHFWALRFCSEITDWEVTGRRQG